MRAVHHWVTHGYSYRYSAMRATHTYTTVLYRYSGRWLCVTHGYATYSYIGTLGDGYARRTPLGDPRVCHVYYGAIGTLGERRTPLGDPRVCHVYYGAIGTLWEGAVHDPRVCHVWRWLCAPYTIGWPTGMPRILRCYRYSGRGLCAPYTIGCTPRILQVLGLCAHWVTHTYTTVLWEGDP